MAEMDVLRSKIILQIETYLTEDNLKNDYNLSKYEREHNGWIPVERLNQFNKLSTYKYETILNALCSKRSNIIELNFCEPISLRRRRHPVIYSSPYYNIDAHRTVVVHGLPRDASLEELTIYFNRFYPVHRIKMLPSSRTNGTFSGKIHVIFEVDRDAREFCRRAESATLIYVNDYVLQLCNGYTLVCQMLLDCNDQDQTDLIEKTDRLRLDNGQALSSRLANDSPRVSFSTNVSVANDDHVRPKSSPGNANQSKSCLKSTTCATEQILFCQNAIDKKFSKTLEYQTEAIVTSGFTYEYYMPAHLLKQTHECMIVAALNPHCFTVQLKQDALEFDHFQREINSFYNETDDQRYWIPPDRIRMNLCVICADPKSPDDDRIWNRSQIVDYDPADQTVNLFYVDLGTWDEYVPINRLRYLVDSFHHHLVFSLTCRLAHLSSVSQPADDLLWPDDATDQFLAVIDQTAPEIELLSIEEDGCFQTNLFIINSGQYVCVNDYMIHIKKARAIVSTDAHSTTQLEFDENSSPSIHPVIALYKRLGETLKQSPTPPPLTSVPNSAKYLVKLIRVSLSINCANGSREAPLVFVQQGQTIVMPSLNIYTLLRMNQPNIGMKIVDDYASAIRYPAMHFTPASHIDLFAQLSSLLNIHYSNSLRFYTIDFVQRILEHHHCPWPHVFRALDNAKLAQTSVADLAYWFSIDNELTSINGASIRLADFNLNDLAPPQKRLPFSNRIISPL